MSYRRVVGWVDEHRDWCFDLLRIYLGCGLLAKGVLFASNPDLLPSLWQRGGDWALPMILVHYVVVAHICGGLLLVVGLVTRIAALVQIPILFSAAFLVHLQEGLFTRAQNFEFSVLVLFLLVLVFVHGSGRWSLDCYLFTRREPESGAGRTVGVPSHQA